MQPFTEITINEGNPERVLDQHIELLRSSELPQVILSVSYPFECYWLDGQPIIQLTSIYHVLAPGADQSSGSVKVTCTVVEASLIAAQYFGVLEGGLVAGFNRFCHQHKLAIFSPGQPLTLSPVFIAKPWGREIWYTGIEQRGVALVSDGRYQQILPYVLSTLPNKLCSDQQRSLILLKVLDPLARPVMGDLYFELHEKKREVYVVTHVDLTAWPSGVGSIRFGFNQLLRASYRTDEDFRRDFAVSVKAYEVVRRDIDVLIDSMRQADGYALDVAVDADTLGSWMQQVPVSLHQQELTLRQHMESFTGQLPLKSGDVVKVPCLTPHSLQHGVRTVEFQTPVYERLIVSFAQKVLTQSYWDTDQAVQLMTLEPQQQDASTVIQHQSGCTIERIVDFEDFEVLRVILHAKASLDLAAPKQYGVLMTIEAGLQLSDTVLGAEQAVLLGKDWNGAKLVNISSQKLTFLLAYPK